MLIVQKFGGSSVANRERIFNAAGRIVESYRQGHKIIVVLSAQGDTTDELIEKALEINENASKRELDMLLSTGEQQSSALMAMALQKLGYPAVSLNAGQAGIISSSTYGNARIKRIETERINNELERKNIVVVTGFQGYNRYGDVTTMGRGASDTTAVAIAAATNADLCEIYTDVDGVYTADPRIVKNARKLKEISYDEMLELASLGAQVLMSRSVEMAKKYRVKLVVRSSLSRDEGTIVKEECVLENVFISGLAVDKDVARISVLGITSNGGTEFRLFSMLAKEKITVDIILQAIALNNTKDISFTVAKKDLKQTLELLEENRSTIGYDSIRYDDNVAKLSVVGAGMNSTPGVASRMFEALYDAGVNINMISTSEIKISVLIDENEVDRAANYVHDKFMNDNMNLRR